MLFCCRAKLPKRSLSVLTGQSDGAEKETAELHGGGGNRTSERDDALDLRTEMSKIETSDVKEKMKKRRELLRYHPAVTVKEAVVAAPKPRSMDDSQTQTWWVAQLLDERANVQQQLLARRIAQNLARELALEEQA